MPLEFSETRYLQFAYQGHIDSLNDDGLKQGLNEILGLLNEVYQNFMHQAAVTKSDPDLSVTGKKNALAKLGREANAAIAKVLNTRLPDLANHAKQLEGQLQPKPLDKEERIVQMLRLQEIRQLARAITDPLQRETLYRQVVAAGNADWAEALETAPDIPPLVRPDIIEEFRGIRLARQHPEVYSKWSDLIQMQQSVADAAKGVIAELKKAGIVFEGGIVEDVAAGKPDAVLPGIRDTSIKLGPMRFKQPEE